MFIRIHQSWRKSYEAELASGSTEEQAKQFADVKVVLTFLTKDTRTSLESEKTAQFIRDLDQTRLIGSRWNKLVHAVGSQEVLLVSVDDEDLWDDDPDPIQVIEEGTEEAFQQCKERLLSYDLGLKDTCLRLSGVSNMILALRKLDEDSEARKFIEGEVKRRVQEVLGKPEWSESDGDKSDGDKAGNEDSDELEETAMDCS
jgi:hypothetical protein